MFRKVSRVATRNALYATKLLGERAALLDQENMLDEAAIDRYAFIRDAYLQHRRSLVYDGNPPRDKFDDEEDDSKPEKGSSNDKVEVIQPVTAEAPPVAAPAVAATSEPSTAPAPAVQRIWLLEDVGAH
jgi:phospholipid-binding lipoprotein MlaA